MEIKERILELSSRFSVTGYEDTEKDALSRALAGFDEDVTDAVGNRILVRRCERECAKRILIDTHFDEIGMVVAGITENGFLRVAPMGGLDLRTLPGTNVRIWGDRVIDGVVAMPSEESESLTPVAELLVDTGYSEEELEGFVRIGTPIGFLPRYEELLGGRIAGKGFDNKACAAAAIDGILRTPRAELAGDIYLLLSVHEETDRIGGVAAGGFSIAPDYAMVIDVNLGRTPNTKKKDTVLLGGGISISRSVICDPAMTDRAFALCEAHKIPVQSAIAPVHTGTNTGALHLTAGGIPCIDIGLPLRAMHTYAEMIDLADAAALSDFVRVFISDTKMGEVLCG